MQTFIDLLKSSALVQGTIALSCIVTMVYLYATGKPVPDTLVKITLMILAYYFGTKTQQAVNREVITNATRNERFFNAGSDYADRECEKTHPSPESTDSQG